MVSEGGGGEAAEVDMSAAAAGGYQGYQGYWEGGARRCQGQNRCGGAVLYAGVQGRVGLAE